MSKPLLILFAKAPEGNQVKTRLQSVLTPAQRGALCKAFIQDTLDRTSTLPVRQVIACAPDVRHPFFQACRKQYSLQLFTQTGKTLGDRMQHAFSWGFRQGAQKVILIGADTPTLSPVLIQAALTALDQAPIVIGPSLDGGYYLIGATAKSFHVLNNLFSGIRWGTQTVLLRTLRKLQRIGHRLLPFWYDIDRPTDLDFLSIHIASLKQQGEPIPKRVLQFLRSLSRAHTPSHAPLQQRDA